MGAIRAAPDSPLVSARRLSVMSPAECGRYHRAGPQVFCTDAPAVCKGDGGSPVVNAYNEIIGINMVDSRVRCDSLRGPNFHISVGALVGWIEEVVESIQRQRRRPAAARPHRPH